jgi:hypothetical protein
MSVYSGDRIAQAYAHGLDEGYAWGETDAPMGLGTVSEYLRAAREDVNEALSHEGRAFSLGFLRGYRDAVRTLRDGRWGV